MTRPTRERLEEIRKHGNGFGTSIEMEGHCDSFTCDQLLIELLAEIDALEAEILRIKMDKYVIPNAKAIIKAIEGWEGVADRRYDLHDAIIERDRLKERVACAIEMVDELECCQDDNCDHCAIMQVLAADGETDKK